MPRRPVGASPSCGGAAHRRVLYEGLDGSLGIAFSAPRAAHIPGGVVRGWRAGVSVGRRLSGFAGRLSAAAVDAVVVHWLGAGGGAAGMRRSRWYLRMGGGVRGWRADVSVECQLSGFAGRPSAARLSRWRPVGSSSGGGGVGRRSRRAERSGGEAVRRRSGRAAERAGGRAAKRSGGGAVGRRSSQAGGEGPATERADRGTGGVGRVRWDTGRHIWRGCRVVGV
ncbi:hypothetical protein FB475_2294 [Kribbella jejuensis]|uniref:Uncharacterized protein n=1 Tax=Kribbella jejuensis TaxID=236068 RepID=A0A542ES31_9ACTN|nr:hypothetical protein FB475_2294 [Kribbella jejuensis]